MIPYLLVFQILILLLLIVGAYNDYKTRTVSNKIILTIAIFSIPLIWNQSSFIIPFILCIMFLGLFYFTNKIGGADTKVFILLLLGMSTNSIFIFFLIFAVTYIISIFKFWERNPLFIPILFGYVGVILLSILPILIRIVYKE
jgi:Flp pilus assembly protein protease CpaA